MWRAGGAGQGTAVCVQACSKGTQAQLSSFWFFTYASQRELRLKIAVFTLLRSDSLLFNRSKEPVRAINESTSPYRLLTVVEKKCRKCSVGNSLMLVPLRMLEMN